MIVPKVELLVGQNANVTISLKVATVSEAITVSAESPLIDTSSSQVAGNVDRRQMEDLRLQGPVGQQTRSSSPLPLRIASTVRRSRRAR